MKQPIFLFNILLGYIFLQLVWWGYLIVEHSPEKIGMVLGEFSVFFFLLVLGMRRLSKAIKEESDLNRQQKNFLLSVTHELKSPITSIKLYLQTLEKRNLDKAQQNSILHNALVDTDRLDDLVGNLLIATKFENKSYSSPKERIDLTEIVQNCIENFEFMYKDHYKFSADFENNIEIMGDRMALNAAINNLVENAIKYSPQNSQIEISLLRKEGRINFQVKDEGLGIKDIEKRKIFQKFYRAFNEETRSTKGTGLGLFIVKQVLDHHKARIQVRDNTPRGSIFEVTFP